MTVAFYAYLILVVRTGFANDYGPTIRSGIVERIIGNSDFGLANLSLRDGLFVNEGFWGVPFSYAPLYAFRILIIGSLLLALIGTWRWVRRRGVDNQSEQSGRSSRSAGLLLLAIALLGAAVAAYLPAWAWWVAPRHNYIPVLFIPLAFACVLQAGLLSVGRRYAKALVIATVVTVLALVAVFAFELRQAATAFTVRDQYREASYKAVNEALVASGFAPDACVEYVDFDISDNTTPFYTEITTWALDMYARETLAATRHCPAGTRILFDPSRVCALAPDGVTLDADAAYVRFPQLADGSRDWIRPQLIPPCDPM